MNKSLCKSCANDCPFIGGQFDAPLGIEVDSNGYVVECETLPLPFSMP